MEFANTSACITGMAALILAIPLFAGPPVAGPSGAKSQSTGKAESSMSIVIGEDAFDRLPETVRMKQDLGDPARRTAVREEYKQGLPKFYPDIGEELQLTAEQVDRLFDPGCDHFGASRGCLRCF